MDKLSPARFKERSSVRVRGKSRHRSSRNSRQQVSFSLYSLSLSLSKNWIIWIQMVENCGPPSGKNRQRHQELLEHSNQEEAGEHGNRPGHSSAVRRVNREKTSRGGWWDRTRHRLCFSLWFSVRAEFSATHMAARVPIMELQWMGFWRWSCLRRDFFGSLHKLGQLFFISPAMSISLPLCMFIYSLKTMNG